jgi:uncharacterized membrane protein YkvA (DUF1232 family)
MSNYPKPALFNIIDSLILPFKLLIDFEVPFLAKLIPILIFVSYLVFPFDVVSDFLPIVGAIDDLAVLSACSYLLIKLTPEKVLKKYTNPSEEIIVEPKPEPKKISNPKKSEKKSDQ